MTVKCGSCFSNLENSGCSLCACHLNGQNNIYVSPNRLAFTLSNDPESILPTKAKAPLHLPLSTAYC